MTAEKRAAHAAQKLVDWVSTVTQLDPEKDELPNADDWRRNAEQLFFLEIRAAENAALERAAVAAEDAEIEVFGSIGSYERPDDGRGTLSNAAADIRALKTGGT